MSAPGRRRLGWLLVVLVVLSPLAVLALADNDVDAHKEPRAGAPVAPRSLARVGPSGARCRGVEIGRGSNPHRVMEDHPPGTTFCFSAGIHRITGPLRPQHGDSLIGQPGAVLNGAKVLSGWRQVSRGWTAMGFLPPEPSRHGECLSRVPTCTQAEDVFLDDRLLTRVAAPAEVVPGTYHADYARGTITVGSDPAGHLVEQAVARSLVRSSGNGVSVRNLVLEKAANEAQTAAVDGRTSSPRTGSGWRVVHNEVRLNHGVGIGVGTRGRVRANVVRNQGQLGISVWEKGARIRGNLISRNGTAGYDPFWEAGGLKAWETESVRLIRNHVHHNRGPGLWSDGGCHRTLYRRNLVTDNWGAGIQHEISYDALITRNRILDNGVRHRGWAWEAGIQIQSSGGLRGIVIRRNAVRGNAHGIMVLQSGHRRTELPAPFGPHVVRRVLVRGNRVTMRPGQWTGLVHDVGTHAVFRRGIRFVANTYRLDTRSSRHFAWKDDVLTFRRWRGPGVRQDRGGSLVLTR